MNSNNFYSVFLRLIFFIPQSATFTPFFTQIQATSQFSLLGFTSEKKQRTELLKNCEDLSNNFFDLKKEAAII